MKPRLLLITFNRLFPADQGNSRRIMQLVRLYRQHGFEIDLVYHCEEGYDVGLSQSLAANFGRVAVVRSRAPKHIQPGHVCDIADWYDNGLDQACRELHRLRGYKVVHCNYVWYAPVLEQFGRDVVKVLDSHDIFANRADKYRESGMVPYWFSTSLQDEDMAFRMADAVLAIQKEEAAEMAARGHQNILYLPYVEPCLRAFEPRSNGQPLTFGYLASGNDWNVRSMVEFVNQVRQRRADLPFPLLVAGGISGHLREMPGLVKLGFVKELHTFYDAIDVALNPMVGGTGLKIKTVEPLSYGKPVLTTPSGAQGLTHLWTLPVFDSPAALVDYLYDGIGDQAGERVRHWLDLARGSRQALDAEFDQQQSRLLGWLRSRL